MVFLILYVFAWRCWDGFCLFLDSVIHHALSILKYCGTCGIVYYMAPETEKLNMVLAVVSILMAVDSMEYLKRYLRRKSEPKRGDWQNENRNCHSFRNQDLLNELVRCLWPTVRFHLHALCKDNLEPDIHASLSHNSQNEINLQEINLGTSPPRFNVVDVERNFADWIVINMSVTYDGDSTILLKVNNCNIGVKDIKVSGKMRVLAGPIMKKMPMVSLLKVSFVEVPYIDCAFTGWLGMVANFSLIKYRILSKLESLIRTEIVDPKCYYIPLR